MSLGPQSIVRSMHFPLRADPDSRTRERSVLWTKRIFLLGMIFSQSLAYKVLTEARYLGQSLEVKYFKFNTVGDILSIGILALSLYLVARTLRRPEYMSLPRIVTATLFSHLLLWLNYGVRNFEASEFSPVASITLIVATCALLGTMLTRSKPERPRQKFWRILRNSFIVFVSLAGFSFLYSFTYPAYTEIKEITDFNADAGVVLGAAVWKGNNLGERPSPTLRERIDVGYELLNKKAIPRLVVTGASAPGEQAEAAVARKEFIKRGVEPSRVIAESKSRSTLDQVVYIREDLKAKQNWERFVIISDQYHLARVNEMCKFNGIIAIGSPSNIDQTFVDLAWYRLRESVALLAYWLIGK